MLLFLDAFLASVSGARSIVVVTVVGIALSDISDLLVDELMGSTVCFATLLGWLGLSSVVVVVVAAAEIWEEVLFAFVEDKRLALRALLRNGVELVGVLRFLGVADVIVLYAGVALVELTAGVGNSVASGASIVADVSLGMGRDDK